VLVLSRRVNEKLLIPCVRAAIQVIAAGPGSVRLGIEAPSHVRILREELAPAEALLDPAAAARHSTLNRLNNLSLGLTLVRRYAQAGKAEELLRALDALGHEFQALCDQFTCCPEQSEELEQPLAAGSS